MIKVLAGIVTYNPDIDLLKKELFNLSQLNITTVIIDNNSKNLSQIIHLLDAFSKSDFILIKNIKNAGIAVAHNQILAYADQKNFDWAILFDQDSGIPLNIINDYEKYITKEVAILCPFVNYLTDKGKAIQDLPKQKFIQKEWAIASASMIRVDAWKIVSGFDENMFIDLVDRDFCIRIRAFNYHIIQVNSVVLDHHLGDLTEKYFMGHKVLVENHSAIRKYYKARNYIYLYRKNELKMSYAFGHVAQLLFETLLFEKGKTIKCKKILKGMHDGMRMKVN